MSASIKLWQAGRFRLAFGRPLVMGIVNVTPDSFSDGGRHVVAASAIAHCEALVRDGADLLDIGGESSRPGAAPLPLDEELRRVMPVLRAASTLGVPVSIDTYKPDVMRAVLDAGADIINDIHALTMPGAVEVVSGHASAGVCLMHMQGSPQTMQDRPHYEGDVVRQVLQFLRAGRDALMAAGIGIERIAIDPGVGFGKTVDHNLALLARQREFDELGHPVLVGWSRKSTLGAVTGRDVGERLAASLAAALLAAERGANVIRVHDVAATVDALKMLAAVNDIAQPGT